MHSAWTRLSLAILALASSAVIAQAQTPDPQSGMRKPDSVAQSGRPEPMGGGMGRMMETMRPMMAEHSGMGMPFEHVEGRIAYLKAELKITDAQSAPWSAFADTMRADATAMKTMHEGMIKGGMPTAMPDRMAAQHQMLSARIGMMERAEASTKALYASLSEAQRKSFDQMMSGPMGMM